MKHYFLFGGTICNILQNDGLKAAVKYAKSNSDWYVYVFEDGVTTPYDLLCWYDGYNGWCCLEEKEYKKLNNI